MLLGLEADGQSLRNSRHGTREFDGSMPLATPAGLQTEVYQVVPLWKGSVAGVQGLAY